MCSIVAEAHKIGGFPHRECLWPGHLSARDRALAAGLATFPESRGKTGVIGRIAPIAAKRVIPFGARGYSFREKWRMIPFGSKARAEFYLSVTITYLKQIKNVLGKR